jgi:hypothetical protein
MHNVKGKQMGRGIDHFYDEGTKLSPHNKQMNEDEIKREARKLHILQPGKLKFEEQKKGTISQSNMLFD